MKDLYIPKVIYLYNEGIKGVDPKELKRFVKEAFGNIKVYWIRLKEEVVQTSGLLFDLLKTADSFSLLLSSKEEDACHIILTKKLFATYDEGKRLHIRAAVFGYPSVISTSGIVEGPAKPKEYYLYKERYARLGLWDIEGPKIKEKFKGRFIEYQDKRITEVLKGYIAQALFFYMTEDPFCPKKSCRLYNAHWQEELIYAQIKKARFCSKHTKVLDKIKGQIVGGRE